MAVRRRRALLLVFGPTTHEPLDELVPRRREQEDESRVGRGGAHLTSPLQVDLEEDGTALGEGLLDGGLRRAVPVRVVHRGPFEQLPARDEAVELRVVDEEVVLAVHFARTRSAGRRGDREEDLGVMLLDVRGDGPLAHGRRAGEDDEAAATRTRSRNGEALVEPVRERDTLTRPEATEPLDGGDAEFREDPVALALADRREGGEELGDAHGTGGRIGVLLGATQQLLCRQDAHRDVLLQGRSFPARRNGTSGCRGAVDLGWAARLDHHPLRYSATRSSMRAARRSGPADKTLRLSLATTCDAT